MRSSFPQFRSWGYGNGLTRASICRDVEFFFRASLLGRCRAGEVIGESDPPLAKSGNKRGSLLRSLFTLGARRPCVLET